MTESRLDKQHKGAAAPKALAAAPQEPADPLGQGLRARRLERGLTLAEAAAAAEISASALSQIERGLVNPTIVTLRRLAAALGVGVFTLLPDEQPTVAAVVVHEHERKTLGLPNSAVVYQLLTPNLRGQLEMLYYEIEPGGTTFEGGFAHEGEECCVVLEGRGELELAGRRIPLEAGDAATYSSGIPHALRNSGDTTLKAFSAITPPFF